jgi:hypothetical protein
MSIKQVLSAPRHNKTPDQIYPSDKIELTQETKEAKKKVSA